MSNSTIQLRRQSSFAFAVENPVLARGEPALETDTNKIKYGDGTTSWNDLPYASEALSILSNQITDFNSAVSGIIPVTSVANKVGDVSLVSSDITNFNSSVSGLIPVTSVANRTGNITLTASDVSGVAPTTNL